MAVGDIGRSLESIEQEAEKVLEEARAKARGILEQAAKERDRILSFEPALEGSDAECRRIVEAAEREAKGIAEKALSEAELVRARAQARVPEVVKEIVKTVRGE